MPRATVPTSASETWYPLCLDLDERRVAVASRGTVELIAREVFSFDKEFIAREFGDTVVNRTTDPTVLCDNVLQLSDPGLIFWPYDYGVIEKRSNHVNEEDGENNGGGQGDSANDL